MITSFQQIFEKIRKTEPAVVSIACPYSVDVLKAIIEAEKQGIAKFILIGDKAKVQEHVRKATNIDLQQLELIDEPETKKALSLSIKLIKDKTAQVLMKGSISTADLLKAVLDREEGLRTGKILSHIFVAEVASYPRLILMSDGGMNIKPDLNTKVAIIKNAVEFAVFLGIVRPNVALLSAIETVNEDMPDTIDAQNIVKLANEGVFGDNISMEGPVALDIALSERAAVMKGTDSKIAGKTDIFIVPDIHSGNIFGKSIIYLAGGKAGGIIYGAKAPIILLSRSDDYQTKLRSIALGALYYHRENLKS